MGSLSKTDTFLEAVKDRRSLYALGAESPIPDSKIEEIVKHAVTWAPSTYNVQSARAVVLFKENHQKFWDIAKKHMANIPLEGGMRAYMDGRLAGWRASYGTVLWFEDQEALDALAQKNPMIGGMLTEWSDHSTGIHQFIGKNPNALISSSLRFVDTILTSTFFTVWTALESEGLGANLQHFNFNPAITAEAKEEFKLPEQWKLKAQLVFGKPQEEAKEKTFEPIEKRVLIKA
ncbi:type II nitroreductase [Cladophialophora chaetospira]|uniref:Type II nitroreductase n=1 Tax=Cladophialophora chaetospira TaxID=386627 RepID=A0AA38X804_9EURO|nr:type II nitroreductase [Cladophialophora chaetospira]